MGLSRSEHRLQRVLTIFAGLFVLGALAYLAGPLVGPLRAFSRHLPFVVNSVVKVATLGALCLYAAGDLRRRFSLVTIVIAAHLVSVAAMLAVLLLGGDVGRQAPFGPGGIPVSTVLWGAIALDGVITILFLVFYLGARRDVLAHAVGASPTTPPLLPAERTLRIGLTVLGVVVSVEAIGYIAGALLPGMREWFIELPFVTNSTVRSATLAFTCFYIARDLRRNQPVAGVVVVSYLLWVLVALILLIPRPTSEADRAMRTALVVDLGFNAAVGVLLLLAYLAAWRERFGLEFFRPMEYRTLSALADVVLRGEDEQVPSERVAANVERYVKAIRARRRWVYRATLFGTYLHPLLYLKAPFPELDDAGRLAHLKTHFYRNVILKVVPDRWRRLIQSMIRIGKQLSYIGYYNDPASYRSVGYVPFSQRARGRLAERRGPLPLKVMRPEDIAGPVLEADVCIIGSGAAGSILAYHLAERGRNVLLVERGKFTEPRLFSEDEVDQIGKLYADGVFQQTEDFRFTILQGSCVGGTTVVNNAVCFDPPERVVSRWNDPQGQDAGLDLPALHASIRAVRALLGIHPQDDAILNPSGTRFLAGASAPGTAAVLTSGVVEANIARCLGCGYCNIGCAYDRKLSMLDTVLPWGQQRFGDRLRIVSECEVERLRTVSGRPERVVDARATLPDGRRVTITAGTFIVSAGTIASSYLLMRSGIGRGLPVGRQVSFNMGSPVTAEFADVLNAYDGLQISHFGRPNDPDRGFVMETWWNPPATQAVNMPGWFENHFANMLSYPRLAAIGVLVGTGSNARIINALTGGPGIDFTPDASDLRKLADGMAQAGRILFDAGARRLLLNTWGDDVITHPDQLTDLPRIAADPSYLTLGTGHPMGGNAISRNPGRGVVDERFRVHGYGNLYVCDASVFPTSLTVNPQLTVMSLAHYAAGRID